MSIPSLILAPICWVELADGLAGSKPNIKMHQDLEDLVGLKSKTLYMTPKLSSALCIDEICRITLLY